MGSALLPAADMVARRLAIGGPRAALHRSGVRPPPGLPALPIACSAVTPLGSVTLNPDDAIEAAYNFATPVIGNRTVYLKPSAPSEGDGSFASPFRTIATALRTTTVAATRIVCLENAVFTDSDAWQLRDTDTSQTTGLGSLLKFIDANGYDVTIRNAGPDLATQSYAADASYTNCTFTVLTGAGAAQPVVRVLDAANLDAFGEAKSYRRYASAALLDAGGSGAGWHYDAATKTLRLNVNAESLKANLRGIYGAASGASRIYVQGSALLLRGVKTEGVQFLIADGAARSGAVWLDRHQSRFADGKGIDMAQAGSAVLTDCLFHASESDAVNAFQRGAHASKGLVLTARSTFRAAGDCLAFNGTLQGSSAHGGTHHVGFGNRYWGNNGQGVADTVIAGELGDVSWLVGCTAGGAPAGTANFFFGSGADAVLRRTAYLDTCVSEGFGGGGFDVQVATGAAAFARNCEFADVAGIVGTY